MEYFARKINTAKWKPKTVIAPDAIKADAITVCLKTSNDTLSVWECKNDKSDAEEILLALSYSFTSLDKMAVAVVGRAYLYDIGIDARSTPTHTDTTIEELKARHWDLVDLDLDRLAKLTHHIAGLVRSATDCHQYTKQEVAMIIRRGLNEGRVKETDLKEGFLADVRRLAP